MDLNVTPDLEALYCYAAVILVGALVARGQMSTKLGNFPGAWIMFDTWLLFVAYTLVPVFLFWLLDRTGAIHDTSLFAAILVAAGYQQILTGNLGTLKAPGEIATFWQPFALWTDRVAERVGERVRRNDARFQERVISDLAKNDQKLDMMRRLVLSRSTDPDAIEKELAGVKDRFQKVGEDSVHENEAKFLYGKLRIFADKDTEFLMHRRGITDTWVYHWYAREWRSKTLALAVGTAAAIGIVLLASQLSSPGSKVSYYSWRLSKLNATPADRFRASRCLLTMLNDAPTSTLACDRLSALLRNPDLPIGSIDQILELMVERPWTGDQRSTHVAAKLIEALRAGNPDARARIHSTLLHLARKSQLEPAIPPVLKTWNPTLGNSLTDLDGHIEEWKTVFSLSHLAGPRPSLPAAASTSPTSN
jgi:hypothetical protein